MDREADFVETGGHESAFSTFQVLPSLLSSDFFRLGEQVNALASAGCRVLHVDVMDGHFVPNLTMGPPVVQSLARSTDVLLDVHLMVTDPDPWSEAFDTPNTRSVTIHAEAGPHLHRSLERIRDLGKKAGLALNPATPLDVLDFLLPNVDLILVMTVNPGFGGQSFIPACESKIQRVRDLIESRADHPVILEIDGGVNAANLPRLAGYGAQWAVVGNALYSQPDLGAAFRAAQAAGSEAWRPPRA